MKIKLTQSIVNNAECDNEKRITAWDSTVPGLYLRVGKRKVYYIYYRLGQVQRRYKLGSADILSLTEARIRARELLGKVAAGVDVAEQKMKKPTIKDMINEYDLYAMNTIRGAKSVISMLRHVCEPILNRPITSLSLSWYEARRMDGQKEVKIIFYERGDTNYLSPNKKRC